MQIISSYFWYFEYICNTNIVFHSRETWKSHYFNKKILFLPGHWGGGCAPWAPLVYASGVRGQCVCWSRPLAPQTTQGRRQVKICGVDRHGEREPITWGLETERPAPRKNSSDLYQFQERPLAIPPQSTQWQRHWNDRSERDAVRDIHRVKLASQSLWSRYDRHFVGITRYNALS